MDSLRLPDSKARDGLPLCAPLRGVVNLSDVPIRLEGWYDPVKMWVPLVPRVDAGAQQTPHAGALWLPKNTLLRSVSLKDQAPLTEFGPVGDGLTVIQPPLRTAPPAPPPC
jgi:hypothetical protein